MHFSKCEMCFVGGLQATRTLLTLCQAFFSSSILWRIPWFATIKKWGDLFLLLYLWNWFIIFVLFTSVYVIAHSSPFCSWQIPYCQIIFIYFVHCSLWWSSNSLPSANSSFVNRFAWDTATVFSVTFHPWNVKGDTKKTMLAHVFWTCGNKCAVHKMFCKPWWIMNPFHTGRKMWRFGPKIYRSLPLQLAAANLA